jgi:hypothetical protein
LAILTGWEDYSAFSRAVRKEAEMIKRQMLQRLLRKTEFESIQKIKEFKALLDDGAITPEEFSLIKKQLLNL